MCGAGIFSRRHAFVNLDARNFSDAPRVPSRESAADIGVGEYLGDREGIFGTAPAARGKSTRVARKLGDPFVYCGGAQPGLVPKAVYFIDVRIVKLV